MIILRLLYISLAFIFSVLLWISLFEPFFDKVRGINYDYVMNNNVVNEKISIDNTFSDIIYDFIYYVHWFILIIWEYFYYISLLLLIFIFLFYYYLSKKGWLVNYLNSFLFFIVWVVLNWFVIKFFYILLWWRNDKFTYYSLLPSILLWIFLVVLLFINSNIYFTIFLLFLYSCFIFWWYDSLESVNKQKFWISEILILKHINRYNYLHIFKSIFKWLFLILFIFIVFISYNSVWYFIEIIKTTYFDNVKLFLSWYDFIIISLPVIIWTFLILLSLFYLEYKKIIFNIFFMFIYISFSCILFLYLNIKFFDNDVNVSSIYEYNKSQLLWQNYSSIIYNNKFQSYTWFALDCWYDNNCVFVETNINYNPLELSNFNKFVFNEIDKKKYLEFRTIKDIYKYNNKSYLWWVDLTLKLMNDNLYFLLDNNILKSLNEFYINSPIFMTLNSWVEYSDYLKNIKKWNLNNYINENNYDILKFLHKYSYFNDIETYNHLKDYYTSSLDKKWFYSGWNLLPLTDIYNKLESRYNNNEKTDLDVFNYLINDYNIKTKLNSWILSWEIRFIDSDWRNLSYWEDYFLRLYRYQDRFDDLDILFDKVDINNSYQYIDISNNFKVSNIIFPNKFKIVPIFKEKINHYEILSWSMDPFKIDTRNTMYDFWTTKIKVYKNLKKESSDKIKILTWHFYLITQDDDIISVSKNNIKFQSWDLCIYPSLKNRFYNECWYKKLNNIKYIVDFDLWMYSKVLDWFFIWNWQFFWIIKKSCSWKNCSDFTRWLYEYTLNRNPIANNNVFFSFVNSRFYE